jgi:hypothetical protein
MSLVNPLHLLASLAMLVTATDGFAATATGLIAAYRISGEPYTLPLCVKLNPPMPDKEWACLASVAPGGEITELLRAAFIYKKICTISWTNVDASGTPLISSLECRQ